MIKLGKRQIFSLLILFFYTIETACPQPSTLAPPSAFEKTDPEERLWQEALVLSSSREWKDKERALELLGRNWENPFRRQQAIKLLVDALKWEGRLKEIAREKLVKIEKPSAPAILAALYKEDGSSLYVWELLETLGEIKDPDTIDPLIELLQRPGFTKRPIADALCRIGHPHVAERLLDLVVDQGRRDPYLLDVLRRVGGYDLERMFSAWRHAGTELKHILFDIILQMPSEIAIGPLIIAIRNSEGTVKTELEKKRDINYYWKERLNTESREILEQIAYYLYDVDKLHIFPDLVNFLSEGEYTGLQPVLEHIEEAKRTGSPEPFFSALFKLRFKKNAEFLALLLDRLGYYPSDYANRILGKETAGLLQEMGITERIPYLELVNSRLFWHRNRPKTRNKAQKELRKMRDFLGPELFNRILKGQGLHTLTNRIILEELVEVELDSRLTILIHPDAIPFLTKSIREARIGRKLFFLGSYTRLAQSGIAQDSFKKFLRWNYNARRAMDKAEIIDKTTLGQMIDAVEKMFYYYKQSFSDDKLGDIEAKWSNIKAEAIGLVARHGVILSGSSEARRITQLTPWRRVDSLGDVETLHDFINFIHQRGKDKRFKLGKKEIQHGVPGELTTVFFTADGRIIDNTKHSLLIGKNKSGDTIYSVPEEVRYILRNIVFSMSDYYRLPEYEIDITGSEVTIFLPVKEHSAELYINLTQPQQGGMVELLWDEGNMDDENTIRLTLIKMISEHTGFSVDLDSTILKATYDSQNGATTNKDILDLGARTLRLISGTRDPDYSLRGTRLDNSRFKDCAMFIMRMGVPTFRKMLREGDMEPYLKALSQWDEKVRDVLNKYLRDLRLELLPEDIPFGPNMINTNFNKQIDRAIERHELIYDNAGRLIRNPDYEEPSQVRVFAELLQNPGRREELIVMANLFHEVIRLMPARIVDIGGINGYLVRRVQLEFPGRVLSLWALYHPTGQILAAYGAVGSRLNRLKDPVTGEIRDNVITSPQVMMELLRKQELTLSKRLLNISAQDLKTRNLRLDRSMARPQFLPLVNLGAAVRFTGVKVSPGLSTGRAVFNTGGKSPEDFRDAVLLAPYTVPRDEPRMEQSEAIVTTGGGPLTHTGIIARELRKPSLIIAGEWGRADGGVVIAVEYEIFTRVQEKVGGYTIIRRININPKRAVIREGDILTIDGTSGTFYNWGQDKDILKAWKLTKGIQTGRSQNTWKEILALAENTKERQAARFLIHKIFAGRLSNILELSEKLEFVKALCSNRVLGDEGREFLNRLLNTQEGELAALIREYSVRIKTSGYPREIIQLMKEVKGRMDSLVLFYKILLLDVPARLLDDIKRLEDLSRQQYQFLGSKVVFQLGYYLMRGMPAKPKDMRHLRNLWNDALFLSRLTRLDLGRFTRIRRGLRRWEQRQKQHVQHLAERDTLTLGQIDIYTAPFVGAKAATLGEIAKILPKKPIPKGFSITDHAFQRFMEYNHLWGRIEEILASSETPGRKYELVQEAFRHAEWPEEMEKEIIEQYHRLERDLGLEEKEKYIMGIINNGLPDESQEARELIKGLFKRDRLEKQRQWERLTIGEIINQVGIVTTGIKEKLLRYNEESGGPVVAIRSSSVGSEDSPEASFAGEMETYLYQRGRSDILHHAKRCMASLWTPRVISYREWHGYPQTGLHHSVFIQLMIDSEVSAVGFSMDPVSGDWGQIVLNSGWGVGEGIMGGRVNTDLYSIDKQAPLGEGVVKNVRYKPYMYEFDRVSGRGVRQTEVRQDKRDIPTLDMKDIETIKRLLILLERYWGTPRDVEFAKDREGNIWIVQDRPVTALDISVKDEKKDIRNDALCDSKSVPPASSLSEGLDDVSVVDRSV